MNLKYLFGALVFCSSVVMADPDFGWDDDEIMTDQPAAKSLFPETEAAPAPKKQAKPAAQKPATQSPKPVVKAAPQPAPVAAPAPQPEQFVPQPVAQPAPLPVPVATPAPQPVVQPAPQPVAQPAPQPAPVVQQVVNPNSSATQVEVLPPNPALLASIAPAGKPLDLEKLTAKDTEDFNTYSVRLQLVTDSITASHMQVLQIEESVKAQLPPLAPKGEFEKASDFEKRRVAYTAEIEKRSKDRTLAAEKRSAELEEAAEKIRKIQAGMFGVIVVKTIPENASVVLSSTGEVKESPARFEGVVPGQLMVTVSAPSFETQVVTVNLKSSEKQTLEVKLAEESIFPKEGEINLSELLLKNSLDPEEYNRRIAVISNRIRKTDDARSQIINKFMATYPKLTPQQPTESDEDFNERREAWQAEGNRLYGDLIRRCDNYRNRMLRAIEVLEDYIVAVQGEKVRVEVTKANVSIGAYDSESEYFSLAVLDTLDKQTPFLFNGVLKMPIDKAATFDRTAPIKTEVEYLNFPFKTKDGDRYIAMSNLFLSREGVPFDIKGSFAAVDYSNEVGFAEWKAKSDSILAGSLKSRDLNADYAFAGDVKPEINDPWTWRAWTRIAAAVIFVGGVAGGIYHNYQANDIADQFNSVKSGSYQFRNETQDRIDKHQTWRNVLYGVAGAGLLAGAITFVF